MTSTGARPPCQSPIAWSRRARNTGDGRPSYWAAPRTTIASAASMRALRRRRRAARPGRWRRPSRRRPRRARRERPRPASGRPTNGRRRSPAVALLVLEPRSAVAGIVAPELGARAAAGRRRAPRDRRPAPAWRGSPGRWGGPGPTIPLPSPLVDGRGAVPAGLPARARQRRRPPGRTRGRPCPAAQVPQPGSAPASAVAPAARLAASWASSGVGAAGCLTIWTRKIVVATWWRISDWSWS